MTEDEIKHRLHNEPDFIALRRFSHSLKKLEERYPDGCPNHVSAAALKITKEDVNVYYQNIVQKLQRFIGVEDE